MSNTAEANPRANALRQLDSGSASTGINETVNVVVNTRFPDIADQFPFIGATVAVSP